MRLARLFLLLALAAAPAGAQAPPDPIGAILEKAGQATPELDEPDTASQAPTAPEPEPTFAPPPAGAGAYSPQVARPKLTAPVNINETGKTPDAPPTLRDLAYESRVRSSFASAQGFQGPLDGGWTLAAQDGSGLYALQLVDKAGALEGAWRDLRRQAALGSSGFVDEIQRNGSSLILRFTPVPGAATSTATLQGGYDGRWTGELVENGQRRVVTLTRKQP